MNQEKQIMSNSWMKASRKKQQKEFMKRMRSEASAYEKQNHIELEELRKAPSILEWGNDE